MKAKTCFKSIVNQTGQKLFKKQPKLPKIVNDLLIKKLAPYSFHNYTIQYLYFI